MTTDINELVSLFIADEGLLYFCSDSLRWSEPSKQLQTVSSWTPQNIYFFRYGYWWFLDLSESDGYDIRKTSNGIKIQLYFDQQSRHPFLKIINENWIYSGMGKRCNGETRSYKIRLYRLSNATPDVPIINRFPRSYQAAFCLTDHADYDQVEPLKAIFYGDSKDYKKHKRGLSGRGLRISKSIFARSFPEYTAAGVLDDDEFKHLIYRLFDEGHEIIPHGIRSFPGTMKELMKDFQDIFSPFNSKTWIDHYYSYSTLLKHSLSTEGLQPESPFYIWPMLQDEGIDLFWSGMDIHNNPPKGKLNLFDLSDSHPSAYIMRSITSLINRKFNESGYFILEYVDATYGRKKRMKLKQVIRSIKNEDVTRSDKFNKLFYILKQITISFIFQRGNDLKSKKGKEIQIFSEKNQFPFNNTVGTFCSMRLNQLGEGLSPEKWKRVFNERGAVLLHTYLACDHYLNDNTWERNGNHYRITPSFDQATEYLAEQVCKGLLWNPTVHEMWEWYKEWKKIRLVPNIKTGKWKILNQPKRGKINYIVSKKDTI